MKKRGLGVGSMFYGIGYGFNRPDIGAAHIEIAEDGTATLFTGVCDLGQGIQTLLAQIVRLVRLTRPDVVLTWLPLYVAGENHADHQAASVIATGRLHGHSAFQALQAALVGRPVLMPPWSEVSNSKKSLS